MWENTGKKYIFIGVEVSKPEEVPLELVVRILPETRYAVYNLKGDSITSDWPSKILDWIAEAGLEQSYTYIFDYYDTQRFKGLGDPESELDIYVPIR